MLEQTPPTMPRMTSQPPVRRAAAVWIVLASMLSGCADTTEETPADSKTSTTAQSSDSDQQSAQTDAQDSGLFEFEFRLRNVVTGETLQKQDFEGKVVIVDLWGTWCGPCLREIPHFVALRQKYESQGLEVLGINFERGSPEDAAPTVRQFIEANRLPYPCVLGNPSIQSQVPDMRGFPTTLFLDRTGTVRHRITGYHSYEDLEKIVISLL